MKQRRKAILALLLSASVAASPIVSATSVFAEDLDFATVEETEVTSEDAGSDFSDDSISIEDSDDVTEADTADDSILIDNSDSAEYSESDTDVFSAGDEVDAFTAADEVSVQADEEAKTHSIKVTVVNSKGVVSGMYAMDNAIITKQDDGTYLVKMHQANKSVVWSSSNTKLATVDKNGKVKAVKGKKGTVKITARAVDGSRKKATIKIRIK